MFELSARRALLSVWLLDPNVLDHDMGWRVAFGSGAARWWRWRRLSPASTVR